MTVCIGAAQQSMSYVVAQGGQAGTTAWLRFRDPANPGNTWSGRGRAPKWLTDLEAQGRSREDEFRAD